MTLRPRDRIALGVVVIAALIGSFYMLLLKPEQHRSSALSAKIATARQSLARAEQDYAAGRAAQSALSGDAAEWAALRRAVPQNSNIPALLRVLERTANAVHVSMQAIQLSSGNTGSGASSSATTGTTSTAGSATSIPVQLTFSGGYAALDALVRRLDRLVVISSNHVTASGPLLSISSVSLSGTSKLTVQLTASIYQLAPASTGSTSPGGQS